MHLGAPGQTSVELAAAHVIKSVEPSSLNPSWQVKVAWLPYLFPLLNVTVLYGSKALGLVTDAVVHVRVSGSLSDAPLHAASEFTSE